MPLIYMHFDVDGWDPGEYVEKSFWKTILENPGGIVITPSTPVTTSNVVAKMDTRNPFISVDCLLVERRGTVSGVRRS